jgi:hypothetical protein
VSIETRWMEVGTAIEAAEAAEAPEAPEAQIGESS